VIAGCSVTWPLKANTIAGRPCGGLILARLLGVLSSGFEARPPFGDVFAIKHMIVIGGRRLRLLAYSLHQCCRHAGPLPTHCRSDAPAGVTLVRINRCCSRKRRFLIGVWLRLRVTLGIDESPPEANSTVQTLESDSVASMLSLGWGWLAALTDWSRANHSIPDTKPPPITSSNNTTRLSTGCGRGGGAT